MYLVASYHKVVVLCWVVFFGSGRKQFLVFRTYVTYCTLQLCGCVSFQFWREIGFGFTYLCTQSTIQLWCCVSFWSWWEIVIDVTYVLSVQYSCAVVSVFWLWRDIFQNENTIVQKILMGYFIMIRQPMCVFIRPNTLLLCIFLFCIFLLYHTDLHVEVQSRILLKNKYRKSCQKCKHRQSHFDFLKNDYPVSLFLRNNS